MRNNIRCVRAVLLAVLYLCIYVAPCVAEVSEHVKQARIFLDETLKILETGNKTNKQKRQIIVNRYMPNIDFAWNAKAALGRPYLQLSEQERKEYINEYTKFLVYTWLPKLNYDTKSGIKMSISDKSTPLTDTDETITLIISMPDGTKYEAFLRTKIDKKTHKFQILNILVEGIDLVLSYRAQFVGYMEQNKNDPRSIIQYLKQQNQIKKQNADFVIPEEFINNK